jgi:hypothetical protein
MIDVKLWKKKLLGQENWKKKNKNCNSYGLMKIWSNFNHSKVFNYSMAMVFTKKISHIILYYITYWISITNFECKSI